MRTRFMVQGKLGKGLSVRFAEQFRVGGSSKARLSMLCRKGQVSVRVEEAKDIDANLEIEQTIARQITLVVSKIHCYLTLMQTNISGKFDYNDLKLKKKEVKTSLKVSSIRLYKQVGLELLEIKTTNLLQHREIMETLFHVKLLQNLLFGFNIRSGHRGRNHVIQTGLLFRNDYFNSESMIIVNALSNGF